MGYLCWLSALYLFTFGTSKIFFPLLHTTQKAVSVPVLRHVFTFLYMHVTYFALIAIFAYILSRFFGYKNIWFVAFMLWPIGISLFYFVENFAFYMNEYPDTLPEWAKIYVFQSILAYFIISPLIAWCGFIFGAKKYKIKA